MFEDECSKDCERFFKPIKRRPVWNFAKSNQQKKLTQTQKAHIGAESMRDSFITLIIFVAEEAEVDMTHLLSYPITRYPLSISYFDGLPMKTDKAVLLPLS